MNTTTFERGFQQGFEQGFQKGMRRSARLVLEDKFGPLSESILARLEAYPAERLEELVRAALRASSLAELGLADS